MRNFDHCGLDYFSCKGLKVQLKPPKNFLSPIKIDLKLAKSSPLIHSFNNYSSSPNGLLTQEPMRARGLIIVLVI